MSVSLAYLQTRDTRRERGCESFLAYQHLAIISLELPPPGIRPAHEFGQREAGAGGAYLAPSPCHG